MVHDNIVSGDAAIDALLAGVRRIAVLGIKTEAQADAPAFYVPKFLVESGFDVVPVPVYYPEVTTILGLPVHRSLTALPPPPIDLLDVFRRAKDLAAHVDDILAMTPRPRVVWLQQGIKNAAFADRIASEGIKVVQDRCLMVELRRGSTTPR